MDELEVEGISEIALDHAKRPRNYSPLSEFNGHSRWTGPCGDTMEYWLQIEDGKLADLGFVTDGCTTSIACGSLAGVMARGESLVSVQQMTADDILNAVGGLPDEFEHCSLLAVTTLHKACDDYLDKVPQQEPPAKQPESDPRAALNETLAQIHNKIAVFSGKGGVGKSTVAVNLASAFAMAGKRVGLLDIDIHGPSIPTMLGCEQVALDVVGDKLVPVVVDDIKLMSIGFLLPNQDSPVVWRGPRKTAAIKQLLEDVAWGELDYLIIDSPPGTGDEPMSICQLVDGLDGAVIVTTPQKVAAVDVRKSVSFCRQLKVPVLGIIENMSGFVCPKCGEVTHILQQGAGASIAEDMQIPFLGAIPMDPQVSLTGDSGEAFIRHRSDSPTAAIMREIVAPLLSSQG
jgi:Mrp family chromosome partitioning ATPase